MCSGISIEVLKRLHMLQRTILFWVLFLCSFVHAQEVVVNGNVLSKRVVFIVDVSASMRPPWNNIFGEERYGPIDDAIYWFKTICEALGDEGYFRVYTFDDSISEYGEWKTLPDANSVADASIWIKDQAVNGGSTNIEAAIISAMQRNDEAGVTFVVITDLIDDEANFNAVVKEVKKRKNPTSVTLIQVADKDRAILNSPSKTNQTFAVETAKQTGGSFYKDMKETEDDKPQTGD